MAQSLPKPSQPIVSQFISYATKPDPSNTDVRFLVAKSQNVIINDSEKVGNRQGFTLQSVAGTTGNPILGSFEWADSSGNNWPVRAHDAVLEVFVNGNWETLKSSLGSVNLIFDAYWDNTEKIDRLIFCDGTPVLQDWSGGNATLSSITSSLLKLQGTKTFGQQRFLLGSSQSVNIKDDTGVWRTSGYSLFSTITKSATTIAFDSVGNTITDSGNGFITAGFLVGDIITITGSVSNNKTFTILTVAAGAITVSQNIITGVAGPTVVITVSDSNQLRLTTNLTAYTFTGGNLILQAVDNWSSSLISTSYNIDFLKVIDNQLWVGSKTNNAIYFSKNTVTSDFSFSTPRVPGEGGILTLDGPGRGIGVLKGDVIIFAGTDFVYKSVFNQLSVGSTLSETVKVVMVKTTSRQSAVNQNLICNIGNGLVWIGADNVMYELIDATIAYNPDLRMVSDPIKPDFIATDFTGGHMLFDKTRIYISAPKSALDYIYEFRLNDKAQREWFWQPPQTFPVQRWAIISGVIHGHSSATNETYKLFDGYNDNAQAIHSVALLARWNGGIRDMLKGCDEMFNEGLISANTKLSASYSFDIDGGENVTVNKIIDGTDTDILYTTNQDPTLGNIPDGDISLSGDVIATNNLPRFRTIHEVNGQEFFDYGTMFETNDIDYQWQILATGSNSRLAENKVTAIKN